MSVIGVNVSNVELAFPSSFLKDISALSDNRYFSSKLNEADCFIKVKKEDQEPLENDPLIFLLFSFPTKELSKSLLKNKSALVKWHFSKLSETSAEEIDKYHTQDSFSGKELKESSLPTQRKRGRPKNSTKPKLRIPTIEETESNSTVGRYSLRGVKLSSKIMKLEMEEPDDNFESESDNDVKPVVKEVVVNDFQKEFLKFDGGKDETNKILDNQQNPKCYQEMDHIKVGIGDSESELDKTHTNLKQNHSELNTLCEVAAMERAVTVENATDLTVHVDPLDNTTEEREEILCNLCPNSEIFESKKELKVHENVKHKDLTCLFCDTPDKKYKHIYSLRGHVLTMHGENASAQNHLCHLCSASYKFASTLKQHIEEIHEGIYKFECDICQKRFYRNSQLNRHKKIHGDSERKLKCHDCGKGFWHEFNLQRHVRLLHNIQSEQFHCSYCGRPFSQKASMISHVQRVHFKLFKFKCDLCELSFEQSKELVNHMSHLHDRKNFELPQQKPTHNKYLKTPDEMFCCPSCTKRFFYKAELIVHIYSFHADTFPFKCRYCPQGFLRRSYLSRHRNVTHKEELTAEEEEELTLEMSSENLATDVTGNGEANSQGGVEYLEEIDMNLNNDDQEYVLVQAAAGQDAEDSSLVENSENVTYIYDYDKDNEGSSTVDSSNEIVTSGSEPMMIDVEDDGQTIRYLIQPSEDGTSQTFKADEFAKLIVAANNNEFEILNESEVKVVGSIEVVETFQS